ncbi:RHS repeat-associated core domain-containing protein [Streptomyces sp. NPDC002952]|uniref:RHS repeat-associated core domain-containing protein n=1 Tax=Streptomyces sp. NPDC002952 TaxID=3364673 RepID=UPI0036C4A18C
MRRPLGLIVAVALVSSVVSGAGSVAFADSGAPAAPGSLTVPFGGKPSTGAKAGGLAGTSGVSPSGAYEYRIPLDVPAGRAGMAPSLALKYVSGSHDGSLGLGWSLQGVGSTIERCGQKPDVDGKRSGVAYNASDRYCLDGQELVGVGGEYGGGNGEYRTEAETFSKIKSVNGSAGSTPEVGPDKFVVFTKDGRIRTYEAETAVREISAVQLTDGGTEMGDACDDSGHCEQRPLPKSTPVVKNTNPQDAKTPRVVWTLRSEEDRYQNLVSYQYSRSGNKTAEFLPTEIHYTSNAVAGKSAPRHVEIKYEPRPDASFRFISGVRYGTTQRISEIKMFAPNPSAAELVRTYKLGYYPSTGEGARKRSMLHSVTLEGGKGGKLASKVFDWSDSSPPDFNAPSSVQIPAVTDDATQAFRVADFNGDGLDDVIYRSGKSQQPRLRLGVRNSAGTAQPLDKEVILEGKGDWPSGSIDSQIVNLPESRPVDIDGDGRDEFVARYTSADGQGFQSTVLRLDPVTNVFKATSARFGVSAWEEFADVNGDGFMDRIAGLPEPKPGPDNTNQVDWQDVHVHVQINDHGVYGTDKDAGIAARCAHRMWDHDGDGNNDLLQENPSLFGDQTSGLCGLGTGSTAFWGDDSKDEWKRHDEGLWNAPRLSPPLNPQKSGFNMQFSEDDDLWYEHVNGMFARPSFLGDFNGDGLQDVLLLATGINATERSSPPAKEAVLWNTGRGLMWDGTIAHVPHDALADVQIKDVNGDGRDDVVSWRNTDLTLARHKIADPDDDTVHIGTGSDSKAVVTVALSDGTGDFAASDLAAGSSGDVSAVHGRPYGQVGDFNGDGRTDVLSMTGSTTLRAFTQAASEPDRITKVRDEGAAFAEETVAYSHQWIDHPLNMVNNTCAGWPLTCSRTGAQVVRSVTSRAQSYSSEKTKTVYYSYADPVSDARHGFLGFGTFREWDPTRPMERVTTFDLRTDSPDHKRYPFAGMPHTITTTVPVLTDDQVKAQPASAKARVTTTTNTPAFRTYNGGKTWGVDPGTSQTTQSEPDVNIDWTADHVADATKDVHLTLKGTAPAPFKKTVTSTTLDDYGNTTHTKTTTSGTGKGGSTSETTNTYDLIKGRTDNWLISIPQSTTIIGSTAPLGTATLDPTSDTFTLAGHGLTNGDRIAFPDIPGTTGLQATSDYVVRDVTTGSFKVSKDSGSAPADILTAGNASFVFADGRDVSRHVWFTANPLGAITKSEVEKDSTDGTVRSTVSSALDDKTGVVTSVTTSAPNRPDAVQHTEYDPVFDGQPDEDVYPSQSWSSHDGLYKPSVWTAVQPAYGITLATQDVNDVKTYATFDDLGRITQTSGDGRPTVKTAVADTTGVAGVVGQVTTTTTMTDPAGGATNAVSHTYTDRLGRVRSTDTTGFDGKEITVSTGYDRLGRVVSTTRPTKGSTAPGESKVSYDTLDRVRTSTTPDGKESENTYPDPFTVYTSDINTHVTETVSDVNGQTISVARRYTKDDGNPDKAVSKVFYGPFGLPIRSVDDKANVTSTRYDVLGRPTLVNDPDRGQSTTDYYGTGQIDKVTHNGTKDVRVFHYDDLGRTTSTDDIDGATNTKQVTTFTFDSDPANPAKLATGGAGQLTSALSPDNVKTVRIYDTLGRPKTDELTVDNTTYRHDITYDNLGRPESQTYPAAGSNGPRVQVKQVYNTYGYLSDLNDAADKPLWHASERDADLHLTDAAWGADGAIKQENHYNDTTGRLEYTKTTGAKDKVLSNFSYTYYDDGAIHTRTQDDDSAHGRTDTYTYDEFNRLHTWKLNSAVIEPSTHTYDYDTLSNLTKVTHTGNTTLPTEDRTYGRGDPPAGPHALASATNTTTGGAESYFYDKRGRLIITKDSKFAVTRSTGYTPFDLPKEIVDKNGSTKYAYDAFGNRAKKTSPTGTTIYTGDFEARTAKNSNGTTSTSYVSYLPQNLGQAVTDSSGKTTLQYSLTDAQGSTSAVTDTTGATLEQSTFYDPYGQRTAQSGKPETTTPGNVTHGYTGHEMEDDQRLINMKGRLYDPSSKTFQTPDPYPNHPYTYTNSDPINQTDPTGYNPDDGLDRADDYGNISSLAADYNPNINLTSNTDPGPTDPCSTFIATGPDCTPDQPTTTNTTSTTNHYDGVGGTDSGGTRSPIGPSCDAPGYSCDSPISERFGPQWRGDIPLDTEFAKKSRETIETGFKLVRYTNTLRSLYQAATATLGAISDNTGPTTPEPIEQPIADTRTEGYDEAPDTLRDPITQRSPQMDFAGDKSVNVPVVAPYRSPVNELLINRGGYYAKPLDVESIADEMGSTLDPIELQNAELSIQMGAGITGGQVAIDNAAYEFEYLYSISYANSVRLGKMIKK